MPKSKRKSKKQQNREKRDFAKQPLLFSSKQWESSRLGRATRRSVILAQVGVDNVIFVRPNWTMKNIHRWGFLFIAIGIALWMSAFLPD